MKGEIRFKEGRIYIKTPYDATGQTQSELKKKGCRWNPELKEWWTENKEIVHLFPGASILIPPPPIKYTEPPLEETFLEKESQEKIIIPEIKGGEIELRHYQEEAVAWLLFRKSAILADDMGLGKTLEAIVSAKILAEEKGIEKILVVAPISLIEGWKRTASWVDLSIDCFSQHHAKIPAPFLESYYYVGIYLLGKS
jgi:hypothetical protein